MFLIYFIIGILAGIIGGLLGTGGCVIIMPVMRFGFNFNPSIAVGTTLSAVFFTATSGAFQHIKMKNVDKNSATIIGICGVFGVIFGSLVFNYLKNYEKIIDLILGVIFLFVSLRMLFECFFKKNNQNNFEDKILGKNKIKTLLGSTIGFLTGIVGLGGGYLLVPSLVFLKASFKLAIGTSMASFVWIVLIGAIFKIYQGVVNINVALSIGIGAFIGAFFGAKLMAKIKSNHLKTIFGIIFCYVSAKYILTFFNISI